MDQTMIIVIVIVAFLLLGCSCSCKGMKKENFGKRKNIRKTKRYRKNVRQGAKKIVKEYQKHWGLSKKKAKRQVERDAKHIQCMMDKIKDLSGGNFKVALQMVDEARRKDAKKLLNMCNMPKNKDSLNKIAYAVEMLNEKVWRVEDSIALMNLESKK